jgi:hypothetical protein
MLTQGQDFDIRILRQPVDRSVIELDFGPAIPPGINPVSRFQRHIDAGSRPFHIRCILKADMSLHIRKACKPYIVIVCRIRHSRHSDQKRCKKETF